MNKYIIQKVQKKKIQTGQMSSQGKKQEKKTGQENNGHEPKVE